MPSITKLPTITAISDETTFIIVDNSITTRIKYKDLQYRILTGQNASVSGTGGTSLPNLSVTTVAPSGNGSLTYNKNTGVFTFAPAATGSGTLAGLTDVNTAGLADGNILKYSASAGKWIPGVNSGGTTNLSAYAGNIVPSVTNTNDLGSSTKLWNNAYVNSMNVVSLNSIGTGIPTIQSPTNINFSASFAVVVTSSPFRLATFTSAQRDALSSTNGDMIYNSTTNKFQGYANGTWTDLN
jgi:hypothetical protein